MTTQGSGQVAADRKRAVRRYGILDKANKPPTIMRFEPKSVDGAKLSVRRTNAYHGWQRFAPIAIFDDGSFEELT